MLDLLWLLLPVAAASGWYVARRTQGRRKPPSDCSPFLSNRYIRGLNYLLNEQQDKALEVFIEMVEVDSETVETHLVLGNLFRRRGEVDRAIRIHQNLIARPNLERGQKVQALLELGRDYMKAGLLDRAEGVFNELIALGPETSEPYRLLRDLYEQEREWERAIETAQKYERYRKRSQSEIISQYFCEIAEIEEKQGAVASAAATGRKAQGLDRHNVRANLILARCEIRNGEYKRAIKHLSSALDQNPSFFSVILPTVKEVFSKTGKSGALEKFLLQAAKIYDGPSLVIAQTDLLVEQNRTGEAREKLDSLLANKKFTPELIRRYTNILGGQQAVSLPEPLSRAINAMAELEHEEFSYRCKNCGFEAMSLFWQCPSCNHWNTVHPKDDWMEQH
jgi:lipopolysaccharide biosynthesis regulator YciM